MSKRFAIAGIFAALALSACTPPMNTYEPIVDQPSASYPRDLAECQNLGQRAQNEYQQRAANQAIGGAIIGALLGAAIGDTSGAALGGAAIGSTSGLDEVDAGPNRVVDRCLAGRGHRVLSDIGRG